MAGSVSSNQLAEKMKVLKWIFGSLAAILIVVAAAALVMINKGSEKFAQTYSMQYDDAMIRTDEEAMDTGRYLVQTHGCDSCHGENLGGRVMIDEVPFLVAASNLTSGRGGVASRFSDADWLRAIRHGVGADGRGLMIMPSEAYYFFSDEEVGAIIGYLKQVDPVDNELPPVTMRALGNLILGVSDDLKTAAQMIPREARPEMPEKGPTAEWGFYRTTVMCRVCHGADLKGAQPPDPNSPLAPDLRVAAGWGLDSFVSAIRTGETPSGRLLDGQFMPWDEFKKMTDEDLEAMFRYLETID